MPMKVTIIIILQINVPYFPFIFKFHPKCGVSGVYHCLISSSQRRSLQLYFVSRHKIYVFNTTMGYYYKKDVQKWNKICFPEGKPNVILIIEI